MAAPPASPPPHAPPPASAAPTAGGVPESRPTGVTILGVLAIIAGVMWVFVALAALAVGSFLGAMFAGDAGLGGALGAAFGLFAFVIAVVALASGYGLLTRKRWGWYLAAVWALIQMLQGLMSLLAFELVSALVGLAIGGVVLWYLLSPGVQAWFGVAYKTPWRYRTPA